MAEYSLHNFLFSCWCAYDTTLPGFAYSSALKMAAGFAKTLVTV
jgi:hypothetical protein